MIGKIIPCPIAVSETKHIKIVGDATHAPANPHAASKDRWEYKAVSYDPIRQVKIGEEFSVTQEEVEGKWSSNNA